MKLQIVSVAQREGTGPAQALLDEYLRRTQRYLPITALTYRTESALLAGLDKSKARTLPLVVLLDRCGRQLSSEDLAQLMGREKAAGTQLLTFAVGPADGWSEAARSAGGLLLSLGPMTLPHELARVVLAEQIYRAATILAGHPYHSGH